MSGRERERITEAQKKRDRCAGDNRKRLTDGWEWSRMFSWDPKRTDGNHFRGPGGPLRPKRL